MADKLTTPLSIPELAASPSNPSSGYQKIYAKSDGKLYVRTSAGTETELTNAAILTLEFGVSSGDVITTGAKGRKACTVTGTIKGWKLITDTPSTITVDVWKANNAIPTNANTITASAKPSITGGQYASSTTLTGWTTAVSNNDVFVFEVESNDNAKYILLILEIEI